MTTDATNFTVPDFSALAASRRSIRAYTDQQIPQDILDAILKDATTAPSWSNTRAFRVALATGERADRLRKEYVRRFDQTLDIQHHKRFATIKTALKRELPDGDFPVWKPYPKELRAPQVEVAKMVYGAYGVERRDYEGRDNANRRNVSAFNTPSWASFLFTKTCSHGAQWTPVSCCKHSFFQRKLTASTRVQSVCSRLGAAQLSRNLRFPSTIN